MGTSARARTMAAIGAGILVLSGCDGDGAEEVTEEPEAVEDATEPEEDDGEPEDAAGAGDDEDVALDTEAELLFDGDEVAVTEVGCSDLGERTTYVDFDFPGADEVERGTVNLMVSEGEGDAVRLVSLTLPLRDGETPAEDDHDYINRRVEDPEEAEFTEDRVRGEATVETYLRGAEADPVHVDFDIEVPVDADHADAC